MSPGASRFWSAVAGVLIVGGGLGVRSAPEQTNGAQIVVPLQRFFPAGVPLSVRTTQFGPTSVVPLSMTLPVPFPDGLERAERINAQALREYQQRFEAHLKAPQSRAVPALYPGSLQRMLDEITLSTRPMRPMRP
jgi:hypothetical protein